MAARTASPADRINTACSSRIVAALLASVALLAGSPASFAQPAQAEPRLEDLIPDSAVLDPEGWVRQDPAAGSAPQAEAPALEPASSLVETAEIDLAWPDDATSPDVEPLSPEPDVQLAEEAVDRELQALGVKRGEEAPRLTDARPIDLGKRVELAFPANAEFAQRDEAASRFSQLSNLRRLRGEGENIAQLARRARSDRDLLERTMRAYGHYDAEVYQTIGGIGEQDNLEGVDPGTAKVRFEVIPGPQYRFGAITFGDLAATGPDFEVLRGAFEIRPGDPVLADRIVAERLELEIALGENGYTFARVDEPELLIDHARREGDLTVPVAPAGKYKFGAVTSSLPEFLSSRHLAAIARFDPGETYRRSRVDDLRRAILATGLVSSATIVPREVEKPAPGKPGTVDLDVTVTKAKLRTVAGLLGYSTDEGFRAEASWEHRNLFPPEGALRVRGVLGTQEQLGGVTFRRNNVWGRDRILSVDAFLQTQDRDAFDARAVSFLASFERQSTIIYQKRWTYSLGLEAVVTGERDKRVHLVNPPRQTFFIGALPGQVLYDASDDLLDPTRGFRVGLRLSPEYSIVNGNNNAVYLKSQFDGSYYLPAGDKIVLAARARLGSITGADTAQVAPSRRFYAGGGGSVRGYGFQRIGPVNTARVPSGGRSLSEMSLEARVRTGLFDGALAVVPFVDAGAVDSTSYPRLDDLRFGAGVGVRYYTNFGPLRVDLATPLNRRKGDSRIQLYVALGQAF